jgi:hypothetical protein
MGARYFFRSPLALLRFSEEVLPLRLRLRLRYFSTDWIVRYCLSTIPLALFYLFVRYSTETTIFNEQYSIKLLRNNVQI